MSKLRSQRLPSSSRFVSHDGTSLRYIQWPAAGRARWEIIGLHGLGSFAESYGEMAEVLGNAGASVYAFDQRGFGDWQYDRRWEYHPFEQTIGDLKRFIGHVLPKRTRGVPRILIGDSTGSLLAEWYMREHPEDLSAIVLLSPFILTSFRRWIAGPLGILAWMVPHGRIRIVGDLRRLTRKESYIRYNSELGLGAQYVTWELLREVVRLSKQVQRRLSEVGLPSPAFVGIGEADHVIQPPVVASMMRALPHSSVVCRTYKEGHHFLLNDLPNEVLFQDLLEFLTTIRTA